MSRIGRLPVVVPNGVQVNVQGSDVHVKGPKGELKRSFSPLIEIAMEDGQVVIKRKSDAAAERALHGTTRAVIANMIHGVSSGFERGAAGGRRGLPRRVTGKGPGFVRGLLPSGKDGTPGRDFL